MSNIFIKTAIHTLFTFTSRKQVYRQCLRLLKEYQALYEGLPNELGKISVLVPRMRGVDEDMRNWSFFEVLEHNFIVNRSITAIVCQLANGQPLTGPAAIDPKKDVMPTGSMDKTILQAFLESIVYHNSQVEQLGQLRGSKKSQHPVFGPFDAHKWNCMFAFHLGLHLPQAKFIVERVKAEQGGAPNAHPRCATDERG